MITCLIVIIPVLIKSVTCTHHLPLQPVCFALCTLCAVTGGKSQRYATVKFAYQPQCQLNLIMQIQGKSSLVLGGGIVLYIGSSETSIHTNTLRHKEQDGGYKALTEIVCLAVVNFCIKRGRKFCYVCETLKIELSSVIFSMFQLNCNLTLYCPTNAHNIKNVELLKHFKIKEAAPSCFGLQGNHHQGATASTQLKLHTWFNVDTWRS